MIRFSIDASELHLNALVENFGLLTAKFERINDLEKYFGYILEFLGSDSKVPWHFSDEWNIT